MWGGKRASTDTNALSPPTMDSLKADRRRGSTFAQLGGSLRGSVHRLSVYTTNAVLSLETNMMSSKYEEEQDAPDILSPPFLWERVFWMNVAFSIVSGWFVGTAVTIFFTIARWFQKEVIYGTQFDTFEGVDFGNGKWEWVLIGFTGGCCVIFLRMILDWWLPATTFFQVIMARVLDPAESLVAYLMCMISISCGMPLGPSSGLGSIGAGFGTLCGNLFNLPDEQTGMWALIGMSGALGSMLFSPVLGPVLLLECSLYNFSIEEIITTGLAACIAYAVSIEMQSHTHLGPVEWSIPFEIVWRTPATWRQICLGFVVGLGCGSIGFLYCLWSKICAKVFATMKERRACAHYTLTPIVGALIGLIAVYCPLTFCDGSIAFTPLFEYGKYMGTKRLMAVVFLKIISYGMASGCGFVGGIFYPLFYVSAAVGEALAFWFPDEERYWLTSMAQVACGGGFMPIPISLIVLAQAMLGLGIQHMAPALAAFVGAHFWIGIGALQFLKKQSEQAEAAEQLKLEQEKHMRSKIQTIRSQKTHIGLFQDSNLFQKGSFLNGSFMGNSSMNLVARQFTGQSDISVDTEKQGLSPTSDNGKKATSNFLGVQMGRL